MHRILSLCTLIILLFLSNRDTNAFSLLGIISFLLELTSVTPMRAVSCINIVQVGWLALSSKNEQLAWYTSPQFFKIWIKNGTIMDALPWLLSFHLLCWHPKLLVRCHASQHSKCFLKNRNFMFDVSRWGACSLKILIFNQHKYSLEQVKSSRQSFQWATTFSWIPSYSVAITTCGTQSFEISIL